MVGHLTRQGKNINWPQLPPMHRKFVLLRALWALWVLWGPWYLGVSCLYAGTLSSQPHYNQLIITRESPTKLILTFSVNVAPLLNKILAPTLKTDIFLKQYSNITAEQLKKELKPGLVELQSKSVVYTPSGSKYELTNIQFAEPSALLNMLKDEVAIQQVPPEFQAHLDPLVFKAEIQGNEPLYRVKLQMSNALMPLWVINTERDKFWLTDLIPLSIINIP